MIPVAALIPYLTLWVMPQPVGSELVGHFGGA